MEELPVEVVGYILSRIAAARDVVLASGTCRKWRQAFREHLRALSFKYDDWRGFGRLSTSEIQNVISRTIFRTTGLQSLVIEMAGRGEFSNSAVVSWLVYTRNNLQELELQFNLKTGEALNVVDIFGRGKLEKTLANDEIKNVDPNFHRFSSLRSLSLLDVFISKLDLGALLAACPKLESLKLIYYDVPCRVENYVKFLDLRESYLDGISSDNLILELDSIEHLLLANCNLNSFKLIGKGTLKDIKLDGVTVSHLELCDSTQNLKTIDICQEMIPKSDFYSLVSKSSKLRVLRLDFQYYSGEVIDLEIIATSCPQLTRLFLSFDWVPDDEMLPYCIQGSTRFENLVFLEVKWSSSRTLNDAVLEFFMGFLEYCPSLKKLVFRGIISDLEYHRDAQVVSRLMGCIIRITRKYVGLDVQVDFR